MSVIFDGSGKVVGNTDASGGGGGGGGGAGGDGNIRIFDAFTKFFGFSIKTGDPNSHPLNPSNANIGALLSTWQGLLGKLDSPGWAGSLLSMFKSYVNGAITDHSQITDQTRGVSEMMLNMAASQHVSGATLGEFSSPNVGAGQGQSRGAEIG
jgi:hypothetical protein